MHTYILMLFTKRCSRRGKSTFTVMRPANLSPHDLSALSSAQLEQAPFPREGSVLLVYFPA